MEISLSEKLQDVHVNEKWGQGVFIDGLAEYIRQFLKCAFEEAIKLELQEMLGRKPYQRSGSTENYRNGSYERDLETRFGVVENINVARDRNGEFYPKVLERYQRREDKIDQRIIELFIGGISTRKMKNITRDLFGKGYSSSTVSKINKKLTEEMRAWMEAPIEDNIKYIYLDGLNLPVKRFAVSKESLLMAIGITTEGYRVILAVQLGDRESAGSWMEFLKDLKNRGLKGEHLELGIMDGLTGLEKVFMECFPKAKTQRCVVHKLRNIAAKLPRKIQKDCLDHVKRVFYADSYDEALERFNDWKNYWEKIAPGAVQCLEKDLSSVLQFYHFPKHHWKIIRTTNIIERTFKEFRRRTRQMDSLPNEDCCLRCVYAISSNLNESWLSRRVDGFSPRRKENAGVA